MSPEFEHLFGKLLDVDLSDEASRFLLSTLSGDYTASRLRKMLEEKVPAEILVLMDNMHKLGVSDPHEVISAWVNEITRTVN